MRNRHSEPPFAVVEAKIQRPVHRDGLIARTRLLEAFAATPERVSLILVTAPAGYGKTTALSQWAAEGSREFAWVTVDEADDDPVRLAGHVALALDRIQPLDPAVFRRACRRSASAGSSNGRCWRPGGNLWAFLDGVATAMECPLSSAAAVSGSRGRRWPMPARLVNKIRTRRLRRLTSGHH